ncbi:hypothetical protein TNCV_293411 [Trichonephila clavipes]|nr:hypothetical protein TNCV_293411 [Trichonephila clavipes]
MCSRPQGVGRVREVRRLQKTDISSYQQRNRRRTAQQVSNRFLLPQKADIPKNCCQTFEGGGPYARRPVVCVPLTRQHRTARFAMVS